MKTILVPLDLTAAAEHTLAYANKLAVRWPAEVVLLHCLPTAAVDAAGELATEEQHLRSLVERLRYQQLTRQDGRRIRYSYRVLAGTLPEHVQAEAVRCAANLVVMGMEHVDCCHQVTPDTHAASLAELLTCPVLVVPAGRRSLPRRVVFSADFELLDKSFMRRLSALAGAFPAPLELVQFYAPLDRAKRRPLKQVLTVAATQLVWAAPITQHLVEDEARLEGTDEFCAREHADLLIIAPTSAGQVAEYFASCYTKTRAYHTQIPVLLLRAIGYNAGQATCCARCAQHPEPQQVASARSVYHTIPWV
jgi:nucleotide-binding universal stress UspA family protein